ncbi:16S rRNA (cytosine(967)-C(5))-methyltransferase RsmB [Clostridia bacterium OttesenSCG-928-F22]|nr:16S rRNA (cytosine(967)-C(5))-methyltransferase RsmB [Clostridia bacterium OttesenSCG-928-F22]
MNKSARRLAFEALYQTLYQDAYANLAIKDVLADAPLKQEDKGYATMLVYGVLDMLLPLQKVVDATAKGKIQKKINVVLLLGAYEIKHLNKDATACNEYVKLAKEIGKGQLSGYVNGVLRNIVRGKDEKMAYCNETQRLSLSYSYPEWIIRYWMETYSSSDIEAMMAGLRDNKTITLRPNKMKCGIEQLEKIFEDKGISLKPGMIPETLVTDSFKMNIADDAYFQKGYYSIQSAGSALAVLALDAKENTKVLDACAAPGGKTALIAEGMQDKGEVLAWDIHPHRVELIQKNSTRLGLSCVKAAVQDALQYDEAYGGAFDSVLVDAPCSGLGVPRKSDIRYRASYEGVVELAALQLKILSNCARYVKQGGTLVYSTCTISPLENERVVGQFLQQTSSFRLSPLDDALFDGIRQENGMGMLYPQQYGQGFFIARMVRL